MPHDLHLRDWAWPLDASGKDGLVASRPDFQQSLDATRADRGFFGHPRGLATLFFTEMWERFSYYGMRALLILFMTASVARGGLGFSYAKAGAIYGLYTGMVYLLGLPGGWVADRITGQRRAVLYGGILIAAGQLLPGGAQHHDLPISGWCCW